MKTLLTVLTCIVVLTILVVPAFSQSNGTLKGIIKDSTGAILPGATITLTNKSTGVTSETISTEAGAYSFVFLQPATYSVSVDLPGFRRLIRDNITVRVAETVVIDVQLEVG